MVIRISGREIFSRFRKFKMKRICNIEQDVFKRRLKRKTKVPKIVSNIEIVCHKENIV